MLAMQVAAILLHCPYQIAIQVLDTLQIIILYKKIKRTFNVLIQKIFWDVHRSQVYFFTFLCILCIAVAGGFCGFSKNAVEAI